MAASVYARSWPVAANGERQIATNPSSTHILDPVDGRFSAQAGREACQLQNQHLAQQGQAIPDEAPSPTTKKQPPIPSPPSFTYKI